MTFRPLITLSPAKKIRTQRDLPIESLSNPYFEEKTQQLIHRLQQCPQEELQSLMSVSASIAALNQQRFQQFPKTYQQLPPQAAVMAFDGDVYRHLNPDHLSAEATQRLQNQVLILSGLYGLLRPFDRFYPYRLEMGTPMEKLGLPSLYAFWRSSLSAYLREYILQQGFSHHLNLASSEYSKALDHQTLGIPTLEVVFKEKRGDSFKVIGVSAKRARGLFTRFCLRQNPQSLSELATFSEQGYQHAPSLSSAQQLVFVRP